MLIKGFSYRKAVQSLNFFATKEGGAINKMKALKLIWLSDRIHLLKYGRFISDDTYFALKNGLVPSNTKDLIEDTMYLSDDEREYRHKYISTVDSFNYKSVGDINNEVFSKSDLVLMNKVYEIFGTWDEFMLSNYSHLFPEWSRYEEQFKLGYSSRFPVDIKDFFTKVPAHLNDELFKMSDEELETSREYFFECN